MNISEDSSAEFITDPPPSSDSRRKIIIIAGAAALLILCCCCGFLWAAWNYGDSVIEVLGL